MAYSEEKRNKILEIVCDRISKGESLKSILDEKEMPNRNTFYEWIDADPEKANKYARATELRAESMFEDILSIADSQEGDTIIVDGREMVNHDNINRARLRVDSRKWILSKMMPKKYGDRTDITSGGEKLPSSSPIDLSKLPIEVLEALKNSK